MEDEEVAWLTGDWATEDGFYLACRNCNYEEVFSSRIGKSIFQGCHTSHDLKTFLKNVDERVQSAVESDTDRFSVLLLGITLLRAFLQVNFTGPALPRLYVQLLPEDLNGLPAESLQGLIVEELLADGERPHPLIEDLLYLLLALRIINHASLHTLKSQPLWRIRASFIHQTLLDDPISSIHNIICDEDSIKKVEQLVHDNSDLEVKWHLELAHYYSYYSYEQKAIFQVKEAERISGLKMQVSGALGRRTKFQTFDVSQLVVLAKSTGASFVNQSDSASSRVVPKVLDLNDDTLLESVNFSQTNVEAHYGTRYINPVAPVVPIDELPAELAELDPGDQPQLRLVDQCILLAYAGVIRVNAASDDQIIIEQVAAYVARVLQKPIDSSNSESNWTVNTAALLARTRIEGHRSRTVERSVLQLQALVDQLVDEISQNSTLPRVDEDSKETNGHAASFLRRADQSDSAPARERLAPIFCLPLASKWDLQLELARKYTSIGLVRSALEIFERLESWESVAMCYGVMDREDKAEATLRAQLELAKPGADLPKLWCLLGDVTSDPQCWLESWKVSGHRYARAQRSLGKYHFGKKDYDAAIAAYALSLKINPLNHGAWFTYGCAALETQQYQVAAEAFTRCISIDQRDGESWNNLASALLRLGGDRKRDAWQALKTATEIKYDSWRMWENYMLVSLDINEVSDAVRAMRRCIEIRKDSGGESVVDVDVLSHLLQAIISEQNEGETLRGTARMVNDLMVNIVQPLITHDARLWKLMAKLYIWRGKYAEALDANEKAYRCLAGKAVETDFAAFTEVAEAVEELTDAYCSLGPMEGRMGGLVAKDWKFKSRSVVRTLKGRGSNFDDTPQYQKLDKIMEDLKSL